MEIMIYIMLGLLVFLIGVFTAFACYLWRTRQEPDEHEDCYNCVCKNSEKN